jgi:ribosome-associated protein
MAKTERRRKPAPSAQGRPEHSRRTRPPKSIELAVRAAEDKKAEDIAVLDLRNAHGFTDYFVICSGTNSRQIRAIADAVVDALAAAGQKPAHVEGYDRSEWVLVDYFDFIVHVFSPDTRAFYGLERLWGTAERVEIQAAR